MVSNTITKLARKLDYELGIAHHKAAIYENPTAIAVVIGGKFTEETYETLHKVVKAYGCKVRSFIVGHHESGNFELRVYILEKGEECPKCGKRYVKTNAFLTHITKCNGRVEV